MSMTMTVRGAGGPIAPVDRRDVHGHAEMALGERRPRAGLMSPDRIRVGARHQVAVGGLYLACDGAERCGGAARHDRILLP
jgi:hypothetical protein